MVDGLAAVQPRPFGPDGLGAKPLGSTFTPGRIPAANAFAAATATKPAIDPGFQFALNRKDTPVLAPSEQINAFAKLLADTTRHHHEGVDAEGHKAAGKDNPDAKAIGLINRIIKDSRQFGYEGEPLNIRADRDQIAAKLREIGGFMTDEGHHETPAGAATQKQLDALGKQYFTRAEAEI